MNTPQIETASMLQARFAPGALGETNSRRGFPIDFSPPLESTVCNIAELQKVAKLKICCRGVVTKFMKCSRNRRAPTPASLLR